MMLDDDVDPNEALLERGWELWQDGELEPLAAHLAKCERDSEVGAVHRARLHVLAALLYQELGDSTRAAAQLTAAGRELPADDPDLLLGTAEVALGRWELERSLAAFEQLHAAAPAPETALRLSLLHDLLDSPRAARRALQEARALDPERLSGLERREPEEFEAVVADAAKRLPDPFGAELANIAVVIDPVPQRLLARGLESETPPDALGLFVGPSALERSHEGLDLPPTIYLFQRNLERLCTSTDELEEEIRVTLYHELGHALGFDEEGVEEMGLG